MFSTYFKDILNYNNSITADIIHNKNMFIKRNEKVNEQKKSHEIALGTPFSPYVQYKYTQRHTNQQRTDIARDNIYTSVNKSTKYTNHITRIVINMPK